MIAARLKIVLGARSPTPGFALRLTAVALLGLFLMSLFPLGYVGGGVDDGRYLEAIRCIVAEGYCIPANHWAARLPLVLPASAAVSLLGETRATLMLVPLAYGLGSLLLFAALARRIAGDRAALVASVALVATPVFVSRWSRLNVDIPELFFLLAAVFLLLAAVGRDRSGLAVMAGAAIGLAVLSRTTAIAAAPIIVVGLMLFASRPARWTSLLALGGGGILAAEAALHAVTAGRPLLSWELAHAHTRIPTTVLPSTVDLSRSPILNPDYIANWHRSAGIEVHWLVDGLLNLLADPMISLTLVVPLALAVAGWIERRKGSTDATATPSRLHPYLAGAAAAYFSTLTFVLAVHPMARMFLPIACIGAFAIGTWADGHRQRVDRLFIAAILATMLASTMIGRSRTVSLSAYEKEAERWVRTSPNQLSISPTAASAFALSKPLRQLPVGAVDGRPMIAIGPGCSDDSRVTRRFAPAGEWPTLEGIGRAIGVTGEPLALCLISPPDRAPSPRP